MVVLLFYAPTEESPQKPKTTHQDRSSYLSTDLDISVRQGSRCYVIIGVRILSQCSGQILMFRIFMPLTLLCFLPFTGFQKEDISRTHSSATFQKTMLIIGAGINISLLDYDKTLYFRLSENVDIQTYYLSFCEVCETHESDIQIDDE